MKAKKVPSRHPDRVAKAKKVPPHYPSRGVEAKKVPPRPPDHVAKAKKVPPHHPDHVAKAKKVPSRASTPPQQRRFQHSESSVIPLRSSSKLSRWLRNHFLYLSPASFLPKSKFLPVRTVVSQLPKKETAIKKNTVYSPDSPVVLLEQKQARLTAAGE
ncbi:hypothetical protein, partial [Cohnella sp.]|uniref:hypothetical protein n=1 Tax=Cohnella sp. TaxID=1883426 RepID=UPI003703AEBE